jgi:hypothetical protein
MGELDALDAHLVFSLGQVDHQSGKFLADEDGVGGCLAGLDSEVCGLDVVVFVEETSFDLDD